ncbi:MAG: hypothetical protein AAFR99_15575 [Cyanobacteria bacterium J06629_9]
MATREEILRQQRDRALEKAAQEQKRAKQIERLLASEFRKRENRRKYIAGGYLLRALLEGEKPCESYEDLLKILDQTLNKNIDRRAFDLAELDADTRAKRKTKRRKKQTAVERQPADKTKPASFKKTSLPPSLIEATLTGQSVKNQRKEDTAKVANDPDVPPAHRLPQSGKDLAAQFNTF